MGKISLPSKAEGFTEIKYDWTKGEKCEEYLKKWIFGKKQTTRIEDIQPSAWFQTKIAQWQKALKEWHAKAQMYRAIVAKKELAKKTKEIEMATKLAIEKAAELKKKQ